MEFNFQNKKLMFSDSQMIVAEINKTIESLAQQSFNVVMIAYKKKILSWENLLDDKGSLAKLVVDLFIPEIMKLLASKKIYDYDDADLKKSCYEIIDNYYDQLIEPFMKVVNRVNGEADYRESRKENRGRVVGGGFGLSGAAKGMVEAGAINVAAGIAHSIFNFAGNTLSAISGNSELSKLFENENVCWDYSNLCYRTIRWSKSVVLKEFVKKEIIDIESMEPQQKKASVLFENLKKKLVPEEDRLDVILDVLSKEPYQNEEYYKYLETLCSETDLLELKKMKKIMYYRDQQIALSSLNDGCKLTDFDNGVYNRLKNLFDFDVQKILKEKEECTNEDCSISKNESLIPEKKVENKENKVKEDEVKKDEIKIVEPKNSTIIKSFRISLIGFVLSLICCPLIAKDWDVVASIILVIQIILVLAYGGANLGVLGSFVNYWGNDNERPNKIKKILLENNVTDPKVIRASMLEGVFTMRSFYFVILSIALLAGENSILVATVRIKDGLVNGGASSGIVVILLLGSIFVSLSSLAVLVFGVIQRTLIFKKEEKEKLDDLIEELVSSVANEKK